MYKKWKSEFKNYSIYVKLLEEKGKKKKEEEEGKEKEKNYY